MSSSILRDPTKLVAYKSVVRDPKKFQDVTPQTNNIITEDITIELMIDSTSNLIPDGELSIWSIWAKMVNPSQIDLLIDNLIKVYESDYISEYEYKLRRRELESLLPQNHVNKRIISNANRYSGDTPIVFRDGVRGGTGSEKGKKQKDNVVRVFLSSTFKDMQEEREELVKRAFPRIREMCAERGLIFKEVDLRWGITEEQATRGDVLDICLSEIDMCRPYFINFVGSRYGWVPQAFPPAIVDKFPFLKYIIPGTTSVTELEVMYGALNDVANASGAFFFLKNVQPSDNQDEVEAKRLSDLRARILSSTLPCKKYSTAAEFAQQVAEALTTAIRRDFPVQKGEEDEQKITKRAHDSHSLQKAKIYVGRLSNLSALDNYLNSYSNKPLLITGDKGIGKSSLVSNWYLEKERQSQFQYSLMHHVGCGAEATDCISMLRRIMQYMKSKFKFNEEIPTDPKRIQRDFARWLQMATQGYNFVLVIDGIDQLADVDGAHNIVWLPENLNSNVKIILTSASNHRCAKVLSERKSELLVVTGLLESEKKVLAVEYLLSYGKTLSPSQIQLIVSEPQTNNPLYLRLLLEELRIFGNFEALTTMFEHYLRARLPVQLLDKILARLEQDYGQEYPGLVRDVMGLLWASQAGLEEKEILEILQVPPIALSALLCGARELFVSRNGLLSLFHDSLRQAVQTRYLDHDDLIRKYHLMLAGYFESLPYEKAPTKQLSRKAEELPFHLLKGEKWYRLKTLLSDISIFEEWFIKRSRFDLKRFWLALGEHYSVSATYLQALSEYEEISNVGAHSLLNTIMRVAKFLKEMLHYPAAISLLNKCLDLCDENDFALKAKIYYRIAQNYWNQGIWEQAEPPCLESLRLRRQCFGENNLLVAKCLCGLGELFVTRDQKKAQVYLEQSLAIRISLLGEYHHLVSRLYHDIAVCKDFYGKFDEAIDLHKRAIEIRNNTLGPENPQLAVSWENLGTTQKLAGRAREAEVSMQKALSINISVHGNVHPSVASCYEWLALIYEDLKQPVRASEYHDKSEKVLSELSSLGLSMSERVAD